MEKLRCRGLLTGEAEEARSVVLEYTTSSALPCGWKGKIFSESSDIRPFSDYALTLENGLRTEIYVNGIVHDPRSGIFLIEILPKCGLFPEGTPSPTPGP